MPHMMDDFPLLLSTLYDRGVRLFPEQEIVSVEADRAVRRATYASTDVRIRRLATALETKLGLGPGDVAGTFSWNNLRHHEIYWATANTGRICHTLNLRLFPEQLVYIINHARERVVFVDPTLCSLLEPLADRLPSVERWVILADEVGSTSLPGAIAYEELISDVEPLSAWPRLDERSPMMLCYTSGTTGNPRGVAYTQRSTYLHTVSTSLLFPILPTDNVLPVVPMFHAAAWGYPFGAVTVGAKLTYPGSDLSPEGLVQLLTDEGVTLAAGVPTIWMGVRQYITDHPEVDTSRLRAFLSGGAALPRSLAAWFRQRGISIYQGWGMTETNPVGAMSVLKPEMESWPEERQLDRIETGGMLVPGLEAKIVDGEGHALPHDDEAFGELWIRGPWIAAEYYNDPSGADRFADGWFKTGDVCRITPDGYLRLVDRAKDVIKSGGEWISSVELENLLMSHGEVAEAAVFAVAHPKWTERPVAAVVLRDGVTSDAAALIAHIEPHVAKWWLPDEVVFVDEIPKTSTGKFDKKVLRERFATLLG